MANDVPTTAAAPMPPAAREWGEQRARRRDRYAEAAEMRRCRAKLREVAAAVGVSTRTLR